ncbi:hypothetical protein [Aquimixticola soesokkakensis]|uniref:hypothetical protein n=1 Tax=Aquimixticola soesokkakensis TaxID=1519096 RepID=UPI000A26D751|nr:hypothetical protein [Aquimixticola soesokkakensis]
MPGSLCSDAHLIHGAWQGAWAWDTGTTGADIIAQIVRSAAAINGSVALVGHSGGGMGVTGALGVLGDFIQH